MTRDRAHLAHVISLARTRDRVPLPLDAVIVVGLVARNPLPNAHHFLSRAREE